MNAGDISAVSYFYTITTTHAAAASDRQMSLFAHYFPPSRLFPAHLFLKINHSIPSVLSFSRRALVTPLNLTNAKSLMKYSRVWRRGDDSCVKSMLTCTCLCTSQVSSFKS